MLRIDLSVSHVVVNGIASVIDFSEFLVSTENDIENDLGVVINDFSASSYSANKINSVGSATINVDLSWEVFVRWEDYWNTS